MPYVSTKRTPISSLEVASILLISLWRWGGGGEGGGEECSQKVLAYSGMGRTCALYFVGWVFFVDVELVFEIPTQES